MWELNSAPGLKRDSVRAENGAPWSLQFEHNADGHVLGGKDAQYDPALTGLPQPEPDRSRDAWQPIPRAPYHEGSLGGNDGLRRVLEFVSAAVRD